MADGDGWTQTDEGKQVQASWDYLQQVWGTELPQQIDNLNTLAQRPL